MKIEDISQQRVLIYDPERCTGCKCCEMACANRNFGTLELDKSHIRIFVDPKNFDREAINCLHCANPVCLNACPVDAISKDDETGWVTLNQMKCIGCCSCTYACPLMAAWFEEDRRAANKCNFCDGSPNCARFCSPQAIRVGTRAEAMELAKRLYLGGK